MQKKKGMTTVYLSDAGVADKHNYADEGVSGDISALAFHATFEQVIVFVVSAHNGVSLGLRG